MSSQVFDDSNSAHSENDETKEGAHITMLRKKIKKFEKKGWDTSGLIRSLEIELGKVERPTFKTGAEVAVKQVRKPGPMRRFREIDEDID